MTFTTLAALLAVFLFLPVVVLLWATESPQQRARRMHRRGHSYRAIGRRLGVAHTTARRYCLA
ncbi:helix-turn-helix domain-containing protein [Herbaspirillum sp.]|uniref:helix-turn-helix domain-containing protein n=1 Tax=Herbaspirillum sp. TaxID=1890675 RepID=UPI000C0D8325|nr:helix-turn-helix domain-containing protein [Herbaspirillum sp.]MBO18816.1 hypothetical protein [Herbaspirillum sp.]|tara:strand:- start:682 stop:870 length:189 start_codon:yes stop_codon:yes gene_type:complete